MRFKSKISFIYGIHTDDKCITYFCFDIVCKTIRNLSISSVI